MIQDGQAMSASDFIAASAGAADAGKGVKLNARGLLGNTIIKPDTLSIISNAAPTLNTDDYTRLVLSAQDLDITSMSANLTGTPYDGQKLQIKITPAGRSTDPAFVAYTVNNHSGSNTLVINKPTGVVDGDIMFALISRISGGYYPPTPPSGWVNLGYVDNTDSFELWYKVASSEGSNFTWDYGTPLTHEGCIIAFRGGFNPTNPIDLNAFSNTAYATNNTTLRAASAGVIKQYSPLIFFGRSTNTSTTFTKPTVPTSDWVENVDVGHVYGAFTADSMVWSSSGPTGNIDATLSGSQATKHAFLIALNPEIDITWGASFGSLGTVLPTKIYGPNPTVIDFVYNSSTSKWETAGINSNKNKDFYLTATTQDLSTAAKKEIAHGLGRVPKLVEIKARFNTSSAVSGADAYYDGTTQSSLYFYADTGTSTGEGSGTTFRIAVDNSNYIEGTITMDNTNVYITWAKSGTPTGTANLIVKCSI